MENAENLMKRKDVWIGVIVLAIVLIFALALRGNNQEANAPTENDEETQMTEENGDDVGQRVVGDSGTTLDIRNGSYNIDGQQFTLNQGAVEITASAAAPESDVALLEGPAFADTNGDNMRDAVVLLRKDTGSTVFYYVAIMLSQNGSQVSTNSLLLGELIRIKSISVNQGIITVTTLERPEGQPVTTQPSVEVVHQYQVEGTSLVEL